MQKNIITKVRRRLWDTLVGKTKKRKFYPLLYISYWHSYIYGTNNKTNDNAYYTAAPNLGAGFGHQMANWIAGVWFSNQFNLKYVYSPFTNSNWNIFLGFGEGEIEVSELKKNKYKVRKLPLFDETNSEQIDLQKKIINSYSGDKVVFVAEQDQFYRAQYGVIPFIQEKFYNSEVRKKEELIYNPTFCNVAVHVRRGDIVQKEGDNNPNLTRRWLDNAYFETALQQTLDMLERDKEIHVFLFSQGKESDFESFNHFENLHFCLDMGAQDSFLHMVYADVLITSKSSFSYKPALLNRGIKVCPENFWHGYPKNDNWWMVDDNGNLKNNI